jgi:hypothetical protein
LALDDAVSDVGDVEAVGKAAGGAGLEAKDARRVTISANEATDGARSKAKDIARLALHNLVEDVSDVEAIGGATSGARLEAKDARRVAISANEATDGARGKAEDIAGLTLDNVVKDVGDVKAVSDTANSAGAKVEGLVRLARAENGANGTGAKVQGIGGVTLDDLVNDVGDVKALSGAANGARAKVEGLVRLAGAEDGADGTGAKVQGVAGVTLDDLVEDVSNVEALSGTTNSARAKVEGLVRLARAENGANGTGAKVQGIGGVTLDDLVDSLAKVEAIGEAADKARVKAESLVSVAAVAAENGAGGTGAEVQRGAGVALEAKANRVNGVGDGVEERGGGAANKGKVALDDGEVEVAESRVEVDGGEKAVDESITLDDAADSLAEFEVGEKAVEEVALGLDANVDVVDDVLDLVDNAALGDIEATDSVEDVVDGATEAAANKAVDEVAGLDTDLDAVDSVLDVVDSSRDTAGKGVVDDAALDGEVEARNNGKAAGDSVDVDKVVQTTKSLTLGGHGEGGRRKGESDKSVLHLEKGVWCVLTKVVSW